MIEHPNESEAARAERIRRDKITADFIKTLRRDSADVALGPSVQDIANGR